MKQRIIFGYGSLIDPESIIATSPEAQDIRPAYVKGFVRDFSFWDPVGYKSSNFDLAGIPFCALDIQKAADLEARVNGVIFTVNEPDFERMLIREAGYSLIETTAYDYQTNELIGVCEVFSSGKNNASFDFKSLPGRRYLEEYLNAAKRYGEQFYQEILDTTFIEGHPLHEINELSASLYKLL